MLSSKWMLTKAFFYFTIDPKNAAIGQSRVFYSCVYKRGLNTAAIGLQPHFCNRGYKIQAYRCVFRNTAMIMTSGFGAMFLVFLSQISSLTTLPMGSSFRSMLLLRIGHAMHEDQKDTFILFLICKLLYAFFCRKICKCTEQSEHKLNFSSQEPSLIINYFARAIIFCFYLFVFLVQCYNI